MFFIDQAMKDYADKHFSLEKRVLMRVSQKQEHQISNMIHQASEKSLFLHLSIIIALHRIISFKTTEV